MGSRIIFRECPTCSNTIIKQDSANGAIILVGSRKFKTENGTILIWCGNCKKYVTLNNWNPLDG